MINEEHRISLLYYCGRIINNVFRASILRVYSIVHRQDPGTVPGFFGNQFSDAHCSRISNPPREIAAVRFSGPVPRAGYFRCRRLSRWPFVPPPPVGAGRLYRTRRHVVGACHSRWQGHARAGWGHALRQSGHAPLGSEGELEGWWCVYVCVCSK